MKSSQLTAFVALTTALSIHATAGTSADDHSKDKAFICAAIKKVDIAYAAKDADGCVAYTDPNFVNMDLSGKVTTHGKEERRRKLITAFAKFTNLATKISMHSTARSVTFTKDGAIVIEDISVSYRVIVNGEARILKDQATARDFWVKHSGGWLEKSSRPIFFKKTLNGRPIP